MKWRPRQGRRWHRPPRRHILRRRRFRRLLWTSQLFNLHLLALDIHNTPIQTPHILRIPLQLKPKRCIPPQHLTPNIPPIPLHVLHRSRTIVPIRRPSRLRNPHRRIPRALFHALQAAFEALPRLVYGIRIPEREYVGADEICVTERSVASGVRVTDRRRGAEEGEPGLGLHPCFDPRDAGHDFFGGGSHGAFSALFAGTVFAGWEGGCQ